MPVREQTVDFYGDPIPGALVQEGEWYVTPFWSPQMELWELDETQWLKVRERARWARGTRQRRPMAEQLAMAGLMTLILICGPELRELGATLLPHISRLS